MIMYHEFSGYKIFIIHATDLRVDFCWCACACVCVCVYVFVVFVYDKKCVQIHLKKRRAEKEKATEKVQLAALSTFVSSADKIASMNPAGPLALTACISSKLKPCPKIVHGVNQRNALH